ncbi:hypothetical protein [uncultured Algibacter sp.]|uniref:hypothetical protein n=1 Tax=uncultured Algibacter sp. TaxID=298659 RepID=UPI003217A0D9
MKFLFKSIAVLLFSLTLQGQNNSSFVFNSKINEIVYERSNDADYSIFNFNIETFSKSVETNIKVTSPAYRKASALLKKAVEDSIAANDQKKVIFKQKSETALIEANINKYLTSKDGYESKKQFLKKAQKISDKYGLKHLIYADAQVNSKFKSKFFVLSANALDLKIHLKKELPKIRQSVASIKAPKVDNTAIYNRINSSRAKLVKTKKYITIAGKPKVTSYDILMVKELVKRPHLIFIGNYRNLGKYYIAKLGNAYKEGQLVSVLEAQRAKLSEKDFLYKEAFVYLQPIGAKGNYLVEPKFLEDYAVNKIAVSDDYRGKTKFAPKIYLNPKDRQFDEIIYEYNKSQLND